MENSKLGEDASFDPSIQTISNASLAAENSSGVSSNSQGLGEEPPFDIHAYRAAPRRVMQICSSLAKKSSFLKKPTKG